MERPPKLKGRRALVTGASRGIGRSIALALAGEGCDVAVNYEKDEEGASSAVREIEDNGRKALAVRADVSDEKDVKAMGERVHDELGEVDILVNNAGIHQHLRFWELSLDDWNRVLAVNLTGPFLVTREFVDDMRKRQGGSIIHVSSIIALTGTDHEVHYAASKAGLIGMTKSMARELAPYNVTVNAVAPGLIETDMTGDMTEEEKENAVSGIPISRIGRPDDIAGTVVFLASEDAAWVTGETVHVNGGWEMY